MTFDDIRALALAWPGVEDGTSYGTPALKVRGKLLARLREDGDSLVVKGVVPDERDMLIAANPSVFSSPTITATGRSCSCGCRRRTRRTSKASCTATGRASCRGGSAGRDLAGAAPDHSVGK